MSKKGILLVIAQPPAALEEEFNAWYDTEHVPERIAVPGFETATRYVAASGARRYLALYDLERLEVLDTPAYARVSGANFSPWTRRVTGRSRIIRAAGTQAWPGDRLTRPCARMLVIRFRGLSEAVEPRLMKGVREVFEGRAEVSQARLFSTPQDDGTTDFYAVVEARSAMPDAFDTGPFGDAADAIDLIETFRPY